MIAKLVEDFTHLKPKTQSEIADAIYLMHIKPYCDDGGEIIEISPEISKYFIVVENKSRKSYRFIENGNNKFVKGALPTSYIYTIEKGNVYRSHPQSWAMQELRSNSFAFNKGNPNRMAILNNLQEAAKFILIHYLKLRKKLDESFTHLKPKTSEEIESSLKQKFGKDYQEYIDAQTTIDEASDYIKRLKKYGAYWLPDIVTRNLSRIPGTNFFNNNPPYYSYGFDFCNQNDIGKFFTFRYFFKPHRYELSFQQSINGELSPWKTRTIKDISEFKRLINDSIDYNSDLDEGFTHLKPKTPEEILNGYTDIIENITYSLDQVSSPQSTKNFIKISDILKSPRQNLFLISSDYSEFDTLTGFFWPMVKKAKPKAKFSTANGFWTCCPNEQIAYFTSTSWITNEVVTVVFNKEFILNKLKMNEGFTHLKPKSSDEITNFILSIARPIDNVVYRHRNPWRQIKTIIERDDLCIIETDVDEFESIDKIFSKICERVLLRDRIYDEANGEIWYIFPILKLAYCYDEDMGENNAWVFSKESIPNLLKSS